MVSIKLIVSIVGVVIGVVLLASTISNMISSSERYSMEEQILIQDLDASLKKSLDICSETESIPVLQECMSDPPRIQKLCKEYPTMETCSDPRLATLASTSNAKIIQAQQKINTLYSEIAELESRLAMIKGHQTGNQTDALSLYLDLCLQARTITEVNDCKLFTNHVLEACKQASDLELCIDPRLDKIKDLQPSL